MIFDFNIDHSTYFIAILVGLVIILFASLCILNTKRERDKLWLESTARETRDYWAKENAKLKERLGAAEYHRSRYYKDGEPIRVNITRNDNKIFIKPYKTVGSIAIKPSEDFDIQIPHNSSWAQPACTVSLTYRNKKTTKLVNGVKSESGSEKFTLTLNNMMKAFQYAFTEEEIRSIIYGFDQVLAYKEQYTNKEQYNESLKNDN